MHLVVALAGIEEVVLLAVLLAVQVELVPRDVLALDLDGVGASVALGARDGDLGAVLNVGDRGLLGRLEDEVLAVGLREDRLLARVAAAVVAAPLVVVAVLVGVAGHVTVADVGVVVDHDLAVAGGQGDSVRALHAAVLLALLVAVDVRRLEGGLLLLGVRDEVALLGHTPDEALGIDLLVDVLALIVTFGRVVAVSAALGLARLDAAEHLRAGDGVLNVLRARVGVRHAGAELVRAVRVLHGAAGVADARLGVTATVGGAPLVGVGVARVALADAAVIAAALILDAARGALAQVVVLAPLVRVEDGLSRQNHDARVHRRRAQCDADHHKSLHLP